MQSKWSIVLGLAAALTVGCQSNNSDKSASASAKEEAECKQPGEGVAVKSVEAPKTVAVFGGEQKLSAVDAVPASAVIAAPDQYKNKYVRVTGTVSAVCPKKGCWLRVTPDKTAAAPAVQNGTGDIFIKFQDPPAGRLIPMDAVGHKVAVEGTLKEGMMPEAAAKHFREEGGASKEELDKIVGPQKQIIMTGPVVAIEGVEKPVN